MNLTCSECAAEITASKDRLIDLGWSVVRYDNHTAAWCPSHDEEQVKEWMREFIQKNRAAQAL